MAKIILSTLNARYIHASLGLRYLYANLGELQAEAQIQEFIINSRAIDLAEKLLAEKPIIIGFGVYIWNVSEISELVALIKTLSPETVIVLGGPEVSYEPETQSLVQLADYVLCGQADLAFANLSRQLLRGETPEQKILPCETPNLKSLKLPYDYFTDDDVANRVIYVEASRGCPFKCEFCLSALDKTAWPFELAEFLSAMEKLYKRGVRQFKFVDRTFNLKIDSSIRIMDFFLERMDKSLFLHFELIPDHLPDKLKNIIQQFPHGSLQFEIGIQSFNPDVQALINRKQDNTKSINNLTWLRNETQAHLHTDLIVGLPGEDLESFARGFDQLYRLNPHEIQVGILKRLRGTPIIRHTNRHHMKYNPMPPYNILSTDRITFNDMQRMSRFARYWDMIANSGRFKNSLPLILADQPFSRFMQLSDWLYQQTDQTHRIALNRLFGLIYDAYYKLFDNKQSAITENLSLDYNRSGLKGTPDFLKPGSQLSSSENNNPNTPQRQARHAC